MRYPFSTSFHLISTRMATADSSTSSHSGEPPRYKQAVITFLGIYPLIMLFMTLFGAKLQPLPLWLNNLIVCLVLVPLLTFAVIPLLNKLFARWLHS